MNGPRIHWSSDKARRMPNKFILLTTERELIFSDGTVQQFCVRQIQSINTDLRRLDEERFS
jgi:hypothetical protein